MHVETKQPNNPEGITQLKSENSHHLPPILSPYSCYLG